MVIGEDLWFDASLFYTEQHFPDCFLSKLNFYKTKICELCHKKDPST